VNPPIQATNPVEVLERALDLLSDPAKWTKSAMAKDAIGKSVQPYEPAAACFCMMGAMERGARGILENHQIRDYYANATALNAEVEAQRMVSHILYDRRGIFSIPGFNDHSDTTHDEVVSIMTEALAKAREAVA